MKNKIGIAIAATLILSSTSAAQKIVGEGPLKSLPAPVILDTAGMFLARYASVGDDFFIAGQPTEERDRFASVPQQSLVDRPPPHAAGRRRVERIEHTAARLPAHERQRRPPERQVSRCAARRPVEHPRHQRKTRRRIVAHSRNLRPSQGERACVVAHRE